MDFTIRATAFSSASCAPIFEKISTVSIINAKKCTSPSRFACETEERGIFKGERIGLKFDMCIDHNRASKEFADRSPT